MSDATNPMDEGVNPTGDDELARAAQAERHAAPVSAGAPTGGSYAPQRDPSVPLSGPYPPAPYAPTPYPPGPFRRGSRERQPVAPWVVVVGSLLVALAILMAGCFIVAGVVQGMLWSSTPASATETHNFVVSGTPSVTLQMPAGNVHVVKGADGQVTATFYKEVHALTHSAAEQALHDTTLATGQSGDTITLTAHIPSIVGNFTSLERSVDLTISVPASANLNLTINAGNADITSVAGTLDVTMNAGNLTLRDVLAKGNSSLSLDAGNLDFRGALDTSAALDATVDAGNATVQLPQTTPTHLAARTSAGNITVTGWSAAQGTQGTTVAHGGMVAVDLNPQPTNSLTVQVSFGNVTVRPGA